MKPSLKGTILFTTAMGISGSIGFFVKLIDLTALDIVFFRSLIASITLFVYILIFERKEFFKIDKNFKYIILTAIFLVLNWIFLFASFKHTSISIAISIYYLAPIFVMLYGVILLKEPNATFKIFIIIIAFIGAILVSNINFTTHTNSLKGVIYALLAAIFYALLIVVAKKIKDTKASHIAFFQTLIGTFLLIFFIDFNFNISTIRYDIILLIGVVHTALMYILFFRGIKDAPLSIVAILGFIDPLIALLLDVIILKSHLTLYQYIGIFLIMGAIFLKSLVDKES